MFAEPRQEISLTKANFEHVYLQWWKEICTPYCMKMAHVVDVRSPLTGGGSYAVYWCVSSEKLLRKHVWGEIEVLTEASLKIKIPWDVAPCRGIGNTRRQCNILEELNFYARVSFAHVCPNVWKHPRKIENHRTDFHGIFRVSKVSLTICRRSPLFVNPLNPELNPICYLLELLGAHHFLHVSRIRVKLLTFRRLMSYIYIYIYMTLVA